MRDPATVTDIRTARRRILPPTFLGDFRGQVPQRRLTPRQKLLLVMVAGWVLLVAGLAWGWHGEPAARD